MVYVYVVVVVYVIIYVSVILFLFLFLFLFLLLLLLSIAVSHQKKLKIQSETTSTTLLGSLVSVDSKGDVIANHLGLSFHRFFFPFSLLLLFPPSHPPPPSFFSLIITPTSSFFNTLLSLSFSPSFFITAKRFKCLFYVSYNVESQAHHLHQLVQKHLFQKLKEKLEGKKE